jgi:hypothetical protein
VSTHAFGVLGSGVVDCPVYSSRLVACTTADWCPPTPCPPSPCAVAGRFSLTPSHIPAYIPLVPLPVGCQLEALQARMHAATLEGAETKARVYELVAEANSARRQLAEVSKELDRPGAAFVHSHASWAAERLAAGARCVRADALCACFVSLHVGLSP